MPRNQTDYMEIKITSTQILRVLYILSWILFIGLCIEAGAFIFNTFYALVINPAAANNTVQGVDLTALYNHDQGYFITQTLLMIIAAVLKACLFYLIIKLLHDKKLNMSKPFNTDMNRFIFNASYLALGIGLFSWWGTKYAEWLMKKGVAMPGIQYLRVGGADVWLFMGVILLVIAYIFRKGTEIQTENELTV